jgi:hypothetical protein
MRVVLMLATMMACALGCDSKAAGVPEGAKIRASALYESCGSTTDCEGDSRCRSGICRPAKAVPVGDYHAAAGRLALAEQRYEDAIAEYTEASKVYTLAKVKIPPDIDCGHGQALHRAGGDPQRYELAARILHRCLLSAPAGSELYSSALRSLAELGKEGLDPELLASTKLADRYMTGKPSMPTGEVVLTVTAKPKVRSYSFTKWMERAQSDEVKQALMPCWQEYWKATRDATMSVTLPLKHSFKLDQYGDFARTTLDVQDLKPLGDSARDGAQSCAKAAIQPIADLHTKGREDERRWDVEMTFTLTGKDG